MAQNSKVEMGKSGPLTFHQRNIVSLSISRAVRRSKMSWLGLLSMADLPGRGSVEEVLLYELIQLNEYCNSHCPMQGEDHRRAERYLLNVSMHPEDVYRRRGSTMGCIAGTTGTYPGIGRISQKRPTRYLSLRDRLACIPISD
jgi:hypothetical protein